MCQWVMEGGLVNLSGSCPNRGVSRREEPPNYFLFLVEGQRQYSFLPALKEGSGLIISIGECSGGLHTSLLVFQPQCCLEGTSTSRCAPPLAMPNCPLVEVKYLLG